MDILEMLNTEKNLIEEVSENEKKLQNQIQDLDLDFIEANVDENIKAEMLEEDGNAILCSVFDDSFIKAENSPFMTYPDDKQDFLRKSSSIDLGKVIQQYRNGEIDERMLRILDIVIPHKYITIRQIWQMYLLKFGLYLKRDNLKRLLNRMEEKGLVVGFVVISSVGETRYHTYCADYNGMRLHTALTTENMDWKRTDILQKPYIIKSSLAKNQFLIAYLKYYDIEYKLQPKLMGSVEKGHEVAVRPALQLTFKSKEQSDCVVFLVDVIRTYSGWEDVYSEKLKRYGQYMKSVEDTQVLKKYYVIICAESLHQIKKAAQVFYKLRHVQKVQELQNIQLFYTYDLELLDGHFEDNLLSNLRSIEYNYEKKRWEEHRLNFSFEMKDWHKIEFELETAHMEDKSGLSEGLCSEGMLNSKKELAIQIYKMVRRQGLKFPQSITKLAVPLKLMGIDYKKMGYKRLKQLFADVSEFYEIHYNSPTEMMVDCTEMLKSIMDNDIFEKEKKEKEYENQAEEISEIVRVSKKEESNIINKYVINKNVIAEYFINGVTGNRERKTSFTNSIFCFKNWEMSATLLAKMTHIYDLNPDGWLNILAFSYHLAQNENRILYGILSEYICFDTGLLSFEGEPIYFLAKKNYREKPEWVLVGVSTVNSKVLGEVIRKEFKL